VKVFFDGEEKFWASKWRFADVVTLVHSLRGQASLHSQRKHQSRSSKGLDSGSRFFIHRRESPSPSWRRELFLPFDGRTNVKFQDFHQNSFLETRLLWRFNRRSKLSCELTLKNVNVRQHSLVFCATARARSLSIYLGCGLTGFWYEVVPIRRSFTSVDFNRSRAHRHRRYEFQLPRRRDTASGMSL
jgi:hypothetical protein